jgi:hypothetical protein
MSNRSDSSIISIRLTPKEHEHIKSAAKKLGVSQADLFRISLNKLLLEMEMKQQAPVRRAVPFVI